MSNVKRLAVSVTYTVALEDIEMSESVKQQLIEIAEKNGGGTVKSESTLFPDAIEWLNGNIREHDSLGHNYTIMDIVPA